MNERAESMLYQYHKVLDHGYVALVDYMGDDSSIVQAARVSYGQGTKIVSDDKTLIRYLMAHRHTTPFEMCVLKFNIAMPIHSHRQMIRHRMSTTNEYSARYSEVPEVTYDDYKFNAQSKSNKQGRAENLVEEDYRGAVDEVQTRGFELYKQMIKDGVAKEIARMHLPLNTYTYYYWKCDLHNLFHYLGLRADSHAQFEVRQYANCIASIVKECYPVAFEAWYDYAFCGARFSRMDRLLLDQYLRNPGTSLEGHGKGIGMTQREIGDFIKKIQPAQEQNFDINDFPLIS